MLHVSITFRTIWYLGMPISFVFIYTVVMTTTGNYFLFLAHRQYSVEKGIATISYLYFSSFDILLFILFVMKCCSSVPCNTSHTFVYFGPFTFLPVYLPITVLTLHSFIGVDPWMHGIIYLLVKIINLHCFELAFRTFNIEVHYCLVPEIDFDFLNFHIKCPI